MRSAGERIKAGRPTKSDAPCGRELALDEVPEGLKPEWWVSECERMAEITIRENAERIEELKKRAAAVRRRFGLKAES